MVYLICWVLFFSCAFATETADAWSNWSKWMKQSGGSNSPQPYWQNYQNWKEWASKGSGGGGNRSKYGASGGGGGSPWSDNPYGGGKNIPEPTKESFDDWRKWNMAQEKAYGDDWKNYGRWQNWVENQKKQGKHPDDNADFGDWQKWMGQSGQGGAGWEKWVGGAGGNGGGAGDWEKYVGGAGGKVGAGDWEKYVGGAGGKGGGAGDWEKYVGGAGGNGAGAADWDKWINPGNAAAGHKSDSEKTQDELDESFEQWIRKRSASKIDTEHDVTEETRHGRKSKEDKTTAHIETTDETETRGTRGSGSAGKSKSKESASTSNGGGNFKDYIPSAYRNYGGGSDSWKDFIPGSYGAEAGGAGAGGSYGATPQTLVAKPSPRDGATSDESDVDWRQFVPIEYRKYLPNKTDDFADGGDRSGSSNFNGEDPDWRKYVPEAYRGNIPPDSVLKAEREKELAQNQDAPPKAMTTIAPTKEQVASTYSFSIFNLAMVTVAVCLALAGCVWNQYKKRFEYEPLDDLDRLMLI